MLPTSDSDKERSNDCSMSKRSAPYRLASMERLGSRRKKSVQIAQLSNCNVCVLPAEMAINACRGIRDVGAASAQSRGRATLRNVNNRLEQSQLHKADAEHSDETLGSVADFESLR